MNRTSSLLATNLASSNEKGVQEKSIDRLSAIDFSSINSCSETENFSTISASVKSDRSR